uniref:hypothetical protein n=1 Tax=Gelidibacter sp. TaxID=2018083 RepID=UPI00404924D4
MNYEYRICCFIDILGFKSHIDSTVDSSGNDVEDKIRSIKRVIDIANKILIDYDSGVSKSKMVTQFSDSIVISFKIEENSEVFYSIIDLLHISFELANNGYLTRGGVSVGKLVHSDKHIFGPALVDAYILESKKAINPRIIVSEEVIEIGKTFRLPINSVEDEAESIMSCISKDNDGYYYIDYITQANDELDEPNYDLLPYLLKLKALIENGLSSGSTDVISKHEWLRIKYNNYISQIQENIKDWKHIDNDSKLLIAFKNLTLIK